MVPGCCNSGTAIARISILPSRLRTYRLPWPPLANPLGRSIFDSKQPAFNYTLEKGQETAFRYRVVVADRVESADELNKGRMHARRSTDRGRSAVACPAGLLSPSASAHSRFSRGPERFACQMTLQEQQRPLRLGIAGFCKGCEYFVPQ